MNNNNIIFIGLDTHKEHIEIAYAEDGRDHAPEHFGRIRTTKQTIMRTVEFTDFN